MLRFMVNSLLEYHRTVPLRCSSARTLNVEAENRKVHHRGIWGVHSLLESAEGACRAISSELKVLKVLQCAWPLAGTYGDCRRGHCMGHTAQCANDVFIGYFITTRTPCQFALRRYLTTHRLYPGIVLYITMHGAVTVAAIQTLLRALQNAVQRSSSPSLFPLGEVPGSSGTGMALAVKANLRRRCDRCPSSRVGSSLAASGRPPRSSSARR